MFPCVLLVLQIFVKRNSNRDEALLSRLYSATTPMTNKTHLPFLTKAPLRNCGWLHLYLLPSPVVNAPLPSNSYLNMRSDFPLTHSGAERRVGEKEDTVQVSSPHCLPFFYIMTGRGRGPTWSWRYAASYHSTLPISFSSHPPHPPPETIPSLQAIIHLVLSHLPFEWRGWWRETVSPPESDDKVTTRYQGGTIGDSTVCMPRGACLTAHALVDRQGGMEGGTMVAQVK